MTERQLAFNHLARSSDPSTSKKAASCFAYARGSQKFLLLEAFARNAYDSGDGLSDEEAASRAGLKRLDSGHKRCSELRSAGLIEVVADKMGDHGCAVRISKATMRGIAAHEFMKGKQ